MHGEKASLVRSIGTIKREFEIFVVWNIRIGSCGTERLHIVVCHLLGSFEPPKNS